MNITIKQQTETNMEIDIPYYAKNDYTFFKIVSETKAIRICTLGGCESILHTSSFEEIIKGEQITEDEFSQAMNSTITKLSTL
jgi:hypothetical protein